MKREITAILIASCLSLARGEAQAGGSSESILPLPAPRHTGSMSLEEAIYRRRSVRSFGDEALSLQEVSQLLWAACGQTVDGITGPSRSAPSAGGLYPLELYLVTGKLKGAPEGIYRYSWQEHALVLLSKADQRGAIARAALFQGFLAQAPATFVITARVERTAQRYGQRGIARYVPMDAGHAAQNLLLQSVALRLSCVPVGAFDDEAVKRILGLRGEEPLYLLPVGRERGGR